MKVPYRGKSYAGGPVMPGVLLDELVKRPESRNTSSRSTEESSAIPAISGFDIDDYIFKDVPMPALEVTIGMDEDTEPVNGVEYVESITIDDDNDSIPDDENSYIQHGRLRVTRDMVKCLAEGRWLQDELVDYVASQMLANGQATDKLNLYDTYQVRSIQQNGAKAKLPTIISEKINMPHVFTVWDKGHYYLMVYFPVENKMVEFNSMSTFRAEQNKDCRVKILAYLALITGNIQTHNADVVIPHVPQQGDGSSCGLFMLHFLKVFSDTSMRLNDISMLQQAQHNYNLAHVLLDREKFFLHIDEEFRRSGKNPLEPIHFEARYEVKAIIGHSKSEWGYEFVIDWEGDFEPTTEPLSNIQGSVMLKEYFRRLEMPVPPEVLGHIGILHRNVFAAGGMKNVNYYQLPTMDKGMAIRKCEAELSYIPQEYTVRRDESFVRLSNDGEYSKLYSPEEFIRAEQTFSGSQTNNCLQVVTVSIHTYTFLSS